MDANVQRLEGTKQAILERLLPSEQHVLAVANELKIRESAIRRHFDQLERIGFVHGFFRQEGLGRPKKYYALTDWGRERFPRLYVDALERSLRRIQQEGRAKDPERAVLVLARDRIEAHKPRFRAAETPLALSRAIERAVGETGLTVRGRIRGDTLLFDLTSCVLLRTALKRDDVPDEWWKEILRIVSDEVTPRDNLQIQPGERLCPPPEARPAVAAVPPMAELERAPEVRTPSGTKMPEGPETPAEA
jgi:predicted ArsR family transcriptional regulator